MKIAGESPPELLQILLPSGNSVPHLTLGFSCNLLVQVLSSDQKKQPWSPRSPTFIVKDDFRGSLLCLPHRVWPSPRLLVSLESPRALITSALPLSEPRESLLKSQALSTHSSDFLLGFHPGAYVHNQENVTQPVSLHLKSQPEAPILLGVQLDVLPQREPRSY